MKISACIDMMFSDMPFLERIIAANQNGMDAIEFWKWSNKNIDELCRIKDEMGLSVSVMNIDSADESLSFDLSRGILNDGRVEEFLKALAESTPVYKRLGVNALIVLIGENSDYNEAKVKKCLTSAIPFLEQNNVNLIIEPLNNIDRAGYSMPYAAPVLSLLREIGNPHIKMLYDIYHQNMMGDFDINQIKENIDLIGHFHVADCPGRHEPGTGNIDYVSIIKEINRLDYNGFIGLEYRATKPDSETFGFIKEIENV